MPLPPFDAEQCAVIVDMEARALRASFPEDGLMHATAWAVMTNENGEPQTEQSYGALDWTQVLYGAAAQADCSSLELVEQHQDLHLLHDALFDDEGKLRPKYRALGGKGEDLLLLDRLQVVDGQDYRAVLGELLDHVLTLFSTGCFGAAYIDDPEPKLELRQLLLERGFQWHPQDGWGFYLLPLGVQHGGWSNTRDSNTLLQ